jgi:hypothetical protein
MHIIALIAALSLTQTEPRTVRDRSNERFRELGVNYSLGEPRADINSGLWAAYDLTGQPDAGFVDSGPNGLNMPVVMNAQGFPKLVTVDGVQATQFSRANTSGSPAVPDNYGRLSNVNITKYTAMSGQAFSIAFWWKRVSSSESTGPETILELGCNGGAGTNPGNDMLWNISRVTNNFRPNWTGPIGNANSYTGTSVIPYNQWNHWVVVEEARPSNKVRFLFYQNGVLVETSPDQTNRPGHWASAPTSSCNMAISAGSAPAQYQNGGYLRLIKVYTRTLSALDVKALYDNGG